jgi:hypothetical protein
MDARDLSLYFSLCVLTGSEPTQPPMQLSLQLFLLPVKRPGSEPDFSPLSGSEVQNDGAITPFPHNPRSVELN